MKRPQIQSSQTYLKWLKTIITSHQIQLQQLGNGICYCLILYHYYPQQFTLLIKRLCLIPKNKLDNFNNLKLFSQMLGICKLGFINFDINRIANCSYQDNMQLMGRLYQVLGKNQGKGSKNGCEIGNKGTQGNLKLIQYQSQQTNLNQVHHHQQFSTIPLKSVSFMQKPSKPTPYPQQIYRNSASNTPLKNPPKPQTNIVDQIKLIVGLTNKTDRQKVKDLKNLLGIQVEQKIDFQEQAEKDLLSGQSKKLNTIIIDDNE